MNLEQKKDLLIKALHAHPEYLRMAEGLIGPSPEEPVAEPSPRLSPKLATPGIDPVFVMTLHERELQRLVHGEMDPNATRTLQIDPPDKVTYFQYVDKVLEVFFFLYNVGKLDKSFEGSLIERIYSSGKVSGGADTDIPIYPWAIPAALGKYLHDFIHDQDIENTLEIGLAHGLSALFFCEAHHRRKRGRHLAIDPGQRENFANSALVHIEQAGLTNYFQHIEAPDYTALPDLLQAEKRFGLIFIDGLHLFDYVLLDFFYADLLLEDGGYLAFDDSTTPAVKRVIDFVAANRAYRRLDSPMARLTLFQKQDSDQRLQGDPSDFINFLHEEEHEDRETGLETVSHAELTERFAFEYNKLLASGCIQIKRPWDFVLEIIGREHSPWRFQLFPDRVERQQLLNGHAALFACTGKKGAKRKLQRGSAEQKETAARRDREKVAVVGLSARLPGSPNANVFWENLLAEKPLFRDAPEERGFGAEKVGSRSGGFMEHVTAFDPEFFQISTREAELMDPHQRILLEETYQCIEDAGYTPEHLEGGRTAVFMALYNNSFQEKLATETIEDPALAITGDYNFTANRISFFFNFSGASETLNTACSSSSVALHRAVKALRERECDVALVGSASIDFSSSIFHTLEHLGVQSKIGICAPFNHEISGLVPGEGAVVVMLKRLSDAVSDRDHVYGSIAATSVNHAGNLSGSPTLTNAISQAELMRNTLERAGLHPDQLDYLEAHGTGGHGDAVELEAIKRVFAKNGKRETPLHVGSVKSYVGFNGAAGGLTQLVKVLLMMKHGRLIPTLGFERVPESAGLPEAISIPNKSREWPSRLDSRGAAEPRRAGLNAYGLGGTAAFLIVEEHPEPLPSVLDDVDQLHCFPLSARSRASLETHAARLRDFLVDHGKKGRSVEMLRVAYTLQTGRKPMKHRVLFLASDPDALCREIEAFLGGKPNRDRCFQGEVDPQALAVFEEHEAFREAIRALLAKGLTPRLAEIWVRGWNVNWRDLYGSDKPEKISLPTYPFARRELRIPDRDHKAANPVIQTPRTHEPDHAREESLQPEDAVLEVLARILKTNRDDIQTDAAFSEYGLSSILGARFITELNQRFDIRLKPSVLFEHPNLESLAGRVASMLGDRVATRSDLEEPRTSVADGEIAVIGMSGRFPGADDPQTFWRNLIEGRDAVGELPARYLDPGTSCQWGGYLESKERFDAAFFNISADEAAAMSPHQRLIMEESWKSLEDAGYDPNRLKGERVGVFIGAEPSGWSGSFTGSSEALIASRVSYFLNLKGPAMVVNTGCSSSGVAIHLACESVRRGESRVALAGGVAANLGPEALSTLAEAQLLSATGRCRTFDAAADGSVFSEGVGVVLLKRLEDALADGDPIHGVISANGLNQDGASNGLTAPNGVAQEELIVDLYQRFRIDPRDIGYVETHGTGTPLGDSVEGNALARAFKRFTDKKNYCALGSAKAHIGHAMAASGVIGLIKVLLSIKNRRLPGLINFEKTSPMIELEDSAFFINTQSGAWRSPDGRPLTAALSTFGHSGANVHLVLREHVSDRSRPLSQRSGPFLIPLSARNEGRLGEVSARLYQFLEDHPNTELADLAFTLQTGRAAMTERVVFLVADHAALRAALKTFNEGGETPYRGHGLSAKKKKDPDRQAAIVRWFELGQFDKIASAWCEGETVDWAGRYHDEKSRPRRLHLPVYPFAGDSSETQKEKRTSRNASPTTTAERAPRTRTAINRETIQDAVVRDAIVRVIADLLLLPEHAELDEDSSFFDLGLDSMTVVQMMRRLSQDLDLALRETLIFDFPSITALTQHIAKAARDAKPREPRDAEPRGLGAKSHFKNHLARITKRYPEAAPLQIEGDGPILFCIHPMSGDVGLYAKFAEAAGTRFRLIGIKSPGLMDEKIPLSSLSEAAVYHAEIMMAIDPRGPYHLFGASMGGTLAYETAHVLQDEGRAVETLLLAESPLVENDEDGRLWDIEPLQNWIMNANFLLIVMLHMDPGFRRDKEEGRAHWPDLEIPDDALDGVAEEKIPFHLAGLIQRRGVKQDESVLIRRLRAMAAVHLGNLRGLSRYRATIPRAQIASRTILFRTKSADATASDGYNPSYLRGIQENKGSFAYFLRGWQKLLPRLKTIIIEGDNHFELLNARSSVQHIADLAAEILSPKQRTAAPTARDARVAVIGMAGRFPGADDPETFWEMLARGESGLGPVPEDRNWEVPEGAAMPKRGGFLKDIACFDVRFFNMSPKEAELMDPSERIFLQESWKAVENAGIDPTRLSGARWGVFCGGGGDYTLKLKDKMGVSPHVTVSGIPGRVAYSLNLTGPVISVDAGCASSALAIAQACDQLLLGKCEVAIAGGVLTHATPNLILASDLGGLISRGEQGFALDARAEGMIPAEAAAALILKPLAAAISDGDRIHGVIEAWGVNHNGRTNGMSAPSVRGEAALFTEVYRDAEIDPATIGMVEANATGTPLGDAVEVQALTSAFRAFTEKRGYCSLGGVENNIGHAFQSSGVCHAVKVLLALREGRIPGALNLTSTPPSFDLDNSPFFTHAETISWPSEPGRPRRAAVNSFGATGINVHLVFSEPPTTEPVFSPETDRPVLICLSAKTRASLQEMCRRLAKYLGRKHVNLARLSGNLLLHRARFAERCALVAEDRATLANQLTMLADGESPENAFLGSAQKKIGPALTALAENTVKDLIEREAAAIRALPILADLFVQGVDPDMSGYFSKAERAPLSLPTYPFEKRRFWPFDADKTSPTETEKPDAAIPATLREMILELTGYAREELDDEAEFVSLGIDSLMNTRLMSLINERFSMDIPLIELFRHNSIAKLSRLVEQKMAGIPTARDSSPDRKGASSQARLCEYRLPENLEEHSDRIEANLDAVLPELAVLAERGVAIIRDDHITCYAHRFRQNPRGIRRVGNRSDSGFVGQSSAKPACRACFRGTRTQSLPFRNHAKRRLERSAALRAAIPRHQARTPQRGPRPNRGNK